MTLSLIAFSYILILVSLQDRVLPVNSCQRRSLRRRWCRVDPQRIKFFGEALTRPHFVMDPLCFDAGLCFVALQGFYQNYNSISLDALSLIS